MVGLLNNKDRLLKFKKKTWIWTNLSYVEINIEVCGENAF